MTTNSSESQSLTSKQAQQKSSESQSPVTTSFTGVSTCSSLDPVYMSRNEGNQYESHFKEYTGPVELARMYDSIPDDQIDNTFKNYIKGMLLELNLPYKKQSSERRNSYYECDHQPSDPNQRVATQLVNNMALMMINFLETLRWNRFRDRRPNTIEVSLMFHGWVGQTYVKVILF